MARKKHNPGCPCCGGVAECYDVTFTDDYSTFTNADGSFSVDRWTIAGGDNIESAAVPPSAESWFHTIHIKDGDCDLLWDGITIAFRSGAGTISDGTNSSIFVPDTDLDAGWQEEGATFGTHITLWVTPGWYAIGVQRMRDSAIGTTTSRGSLQVIDRDNTSAAKPLKITAATGGTEIASWRIAESTVTVEGGSSGTITRECFKPRATGETGLPICTERFYQSLTSLNTRVFTTYTVDRYEVVETAPFSDVYECVYLDTLTGETGVFVDAFGDTLTAIGEGNCGIGGGMGRSTPALVGNVSQGVKLLAATAAIPYPKPVSLFIVTLAAPGLCTAGDSDGGNTEVVFAADGTAAAMWSLSLTGIDDLYWECFTPLTCGATFPDDLRVAVSAVLTAAAE